MVGIYILLAGLVLSLASCGGSNLKNPVSEEVTTEEGSEATDDVVVTQISNAEEPEQVTDLDVKNYRYEKNGATW